MSQYAFTPQAVNDLFEVWSYIADDSPEAADRVEAAIHEACDLLASRPHMGTIREDLTTLPVRFWFVPPFRNYFIVYDPETKPLVIVRVLHRSRNISEILP